MNATLHIIGVGPGDPELLTRKALCTLEACPVIATPKGSKDGSSTALSIVEQALSLKGKEVIELFFPMKKIHLDTAPAVEVQEAWKEAAVQILNFMKQGKDVVFPTLGDPAIYSTGYYLYETILSLQPDTRVKFVPGISAMSSCSAATSIPICLGDDKLAVIPATFSGEQLRQTLESFDTIVLMKVHRVLDRIVGLLRELDLLEKAVLVERAGMKEENILTDLGSITDQVHYFSTIIVRKRSGCRR
ncbi:MAG: precorrin-2 C(20)-methyltransferase [Proteobacteria bacterium]|nr:precorrin-2 C(20)-methyltransferase [Pseudomonadota bacterium]MBU1420011.1 precorrin-2 C(20)-methyltransferase [Pseudomonadota bacterium]MBU1455195.1 precorrin-2 C(20)-methyltransferase [Pseudomonadota bacterium]